MVCKKLIAPSILSADFGNLAREVKAAEEAGADMVHVDVMDGHFVPNITIGPLVVEAVRRNTRLPIDVHLMIENPQNFVAAFVKAGAQWVSIHVEEGYHLDRTLDQIRGLGAKAGVVLNPATPLAAIGSVLSAVDYVLLMTVNPGFGGQRFIPYCKDKIRQLRKTIDQAHSGVMLEIDGGVTVANISELSQCGADVFVTGSAVFGSENYKKTIAAMKKAIA